MNEEDDTGFLLRDENARRQVNRLIDHDQQNTVLEQIFPSSDDHRFFSIHRRSFLKQCTLSCVGFIVISICMAAILIPIAVVVSGNRRKLPDDPFLRASNLLATQAPLIDTHDDLPLAVQYLVKSCSQKVLLNETMSLRKKKELMEKCGIDLQSDIPRYQNGRVGAVFLVAYTSCSNVTNPSQKFVEPTMKMFDIINQIVNKNSNVMTLATSYAQIWNAYRSQKIAALIGVEGGHSIQNSLSILREYYRMGARYMTLTHNCHLDWADSCCDQSPPKHEYGLSPFGIQVIQEMNRLGMIVDISHTAVSTMKESIRTSKAPVIFSHSNVYDLCNHPRNVPKIVIGMLQEKNGIIMISYVPSFTSDKERIANQQITSQNNDTLIANQKIREWQIAHPNERATLSKVVDHIDYIKEITGTVDHIGIGSDFNGISTVTMGLEDTSKLFI
jgi:membrane dipeptidase